MIQEIKEHYSADNVELNKTNIENIVFSAVQEYLKYGTRYNEDYKANYDNKKSVMWNIDIKGTQAEIFEILDTIRDKFNLSCEAYEQ